MDATQKRRMWLITTGHFILSVAAFLFSINFNAHFWIFFIFQPQFAIFLEVIALLDNLGWICAKDIPLFWHLLPFCLAPAWSICFGWIAVSLKDWLIHFIHWLNHFPILRKRVF